MSLFSDPIVDGYAGIVFGCVMGMGGSIVGGAVAGIAEFGYGAVTGERLFGRNFGYFGSYALSAKLLMHLTPHKTIFYTCMKIGVVAQAILIASVGAVQQEGAIKSLKGLGKGLVSGAIATSVLALAGLPIAVVLGAGMVIANHVAGSQMNVELAQAAQNAQIAVPGH